MRYLQKDSLVKKTIRDFATKNKTFYQKLTDFFSDNRSDLLLIITLAVVTGITTFYHSQLVDPILYLQQTIDVLFDSDIAPVFTALTSPNADFSDKSIHPLLPSFGYLLGLPFHIIDMEHITSARIIISVIAAYVIGTFFIILRLLSYPRLDASLFSVFAANTAAAQFWFAIPEHYALGTATLLSALCLVAVARHHQVTFYWYIVVNILTLGVTTTNWMAGIAATIATQPWKRALRIFFGTLVVLACLVSIQKIFFPTAALKAIVGTGSQMSYVHFPPTDLLDRYQVFFFHSIVMPAIGTIENWNPSAWPYLMTVQHSTIGSGSVYGIVATAAWAILLGLGLWSFFSIEQYPQLRLTLGLTLLGQFILHTFHGRETFLYSLHYSLLLVMLASLVTLTRMRKIGLALVLVLILTAGINNSLQFHGAMEMVQQWKHQLPEQFPSRPL